MIPIPDNPPSTPFVSNVWVSGLGARWWLGELESAVKRAPAKRAAKKRTEYIPTLDEHEIHLIEPSNAALPNEKMPPSEATSQ